MNLKELTSNNVQKANDRGVFHNVKFNGKDFVLDNIINQAKDNLLELQTDLESIIYNGDREKAKTEIMKRSKQNLNQGRRAVNKNILGNAINKSPSLINNIMEIQKKNLINQKISDRSISQKKNFSLISSVSLNSKFQGNSSTKDLREKINLKSLPLVNSSYSKNLNNRGTKKLLNNNIKFNRLNLMNNFEGGVGLHSPLKTLKLRNQEQIENDRYFHEKTQESASPKGKKISFESEYMNSFINKNNNNNLVNNTNNNNKLNCNINANKNINSIGDQNSIEDFNLNNISNNNCANNQPHTTKSNASQSRNKMDSEPPKNDGFVGFNPNSLLNLIKKENENNQISNNNNNININNISNNDGMQSTLYRTGFNSTINFNANSTNNITSSIFRSTQLNLGLIAATAPQNEVDSNPTTTTDSDLASNRSFFNRINNISNANRKYSVSGLKQVNKENISDPNDNNNNNTIITNLPNQNQSHRKTKAFGLLSKPSLNTLNFNSVNEANKKNNNLSKISEVNSPNRQNSTTNKAPERKISLANQAQPQIQTKNPSLILNTNNLNFNKTFHSNSLRSSSNHNLLNNTQSYKNSNKLDFFKTQDFDFKSTAGKKRVLPHLIQGFKSIESEMTGIKSNLSKAIKDLDDSIEKGEKHKSKYNREFAGEGENTSDVFLYGNNGEGFYMSNQKIMREASILKSMKCENIFKHKRFFSHRFELNANEKEKPIENGLSRGTETKFKMVEGFLDGTEDMKKRAIKHIEIHQMKVRMESLNENSHEDTEDDFNVE